MINIIYKLLGQFVRHAILTTGNTCLKYSDFANLENPKDLWGKASLARKNKEYNETMDGWEERFYDVFRGFRKGILA